MKFCIFFNSKNKNCFLLGDYNVDLSKGDTAKIYFMNAPHSSLLLTLLQEILIPLNLSQTTSSQILGALSWSPE